LGGVLETERLMRYVDNMLDLETEVEIAYAEMTEHFYRDHITHMIRTFLLAFYLGQEAGIGFDVHKLALACLFHDMAVPGEEAEEILKGHAQLIRDTYSCFEVSEVSVEMTGNKEEFLRNLGSVKREGLSLTKDLREILSEGLKPKKKKHDVLSAFELWTMLRHKDDDDLLGPLLAVALHHAELGVGAVTTKFPELFLLILADELQEWGRKAFVVGTYQFFNDNKVTVEIDNAQSIKFNFDVSYRRSSIAVPGRVKPLTAEPVFGRLMQIEAKVKGLKRLSSSNCEVTVKFITGHNYVTVPDYDSEAEDHWLRLYKDDNSIPEEILELSSHGKEPTGFPDSFDEVILRLQGGQVSLCLGGRNISDYPRDVSAGPIELLLSLTALYTEIYTHSPAIHELRKTVAMGFLMVVVPDAPHEINVLQREASKRKVLVPSHMKPLWGGASDFSHIPYIKGIISIGTELLTKFREGSIKRGDIPTAVYKHVEQLPPL